MKQGSNKSDNLVKILLVLLTCLGTVVVVSALGFMIGVFIYITFISPGVGDGEDLLTAYSFGVLSVIPSFFVSIIITILVSRKILWKLN